MSEFKVGDVVVTVFSYNMTFVKFWKVVNMTKTGKTLTMRRVTSVETCPKGSNGFYGTCVAGNHFLNDADVKTLARKCRKWEGEPMYFNSLD